MKNTKQISRAFSTPRSVLLAIVRRGGKRPCDVDPRKFSRMERMLHRQWAELAG